MVVKLLGVRVIVGLTVLVATFTVVVPVQPFTLSVTRTV